MAQTPQVFLSSTLYDLHQLRADVGAFVESLGYGLLDSTDPRFFADPAVDTVTACLHEVRRSDMLILVIGGRYGSARSGSRRSITNEEWTLARSLGIPVFTFVYQPVWETLPLWSRAHDQSYEPHVEDNRVFEFIQEVVDGAHNNWVWPFRTAQDVIAVLRQQWAAMFATSLSERLDRDMIQVHPSRQALISDYVKKLQGAVRSIDLLGVSLATVARSAGIEKAIRSACDRGVMLRVLIMKSDCAAAQERAVEEYGEQSLPSELHSMASLWEQLTQGIATAEVRRYTGRAALFFFRVDNDRSVSFYPIGDSGANAPTFSFHAVTDPAEYFQSRFDELWDASEQS